MEQRQAYWSKITTEIERNLGYSHPFADGQKFTRISGIQPSYPTLSFEGVIWSSSEFAMLLKVTEHVAQCEFDIIKNRVTANIVQ